MSGFLPESGISTILLVVIMVLFGLSIYLPWKKKASAIAVISTSIVIVFILQLLLSSDLFQSLPLIDQMKPATYDQIIVDLGLNPKTIIYDQTMYQLVTSMYLHGDFLHLIFNFIGLFILGVQMEKKIGWSRFLVLYYGSGIIGGAIVLIVSPFDQLGHGMNVVSIGASGAIFGIIGGYWLMYPKDKILFPLPLIFFRLYNKWPVWLIFLIYGGITTFFLLFQTDDNVSHLGHFGGLVGSFPIAALIKPPAEPEKIKKMKKIDLEKYAKTSKQKEYLRKAMESDEEDVRNAWLDEFFQNITCEKCKASHFSFEDGKAVCPKCGHTIKP